MENPYAPNGGLVQRAKAIILQPAETWPLVAAEQTNPGDLITRYAIPLIVLGAVAGFIGGQVFGYGGFFGTFRPSLVGGLITAVLITVMGVVAVVVIGLVADFLADKFDGTADRTAAFKLVVYSMTPGWAAAVLKIYPPLAALGILAGLYGLYLFYQGATPLMKVPAEKAVGYTAVTTIAAIVLLWVASMVTFSITGMLGLGAAGMMGMHSGTAEVNIPGVGKVDTAQIEQASKQLEAAASGNIKPVDTARLQALLPASLGSYARTSLDSGAAGQMGKGVSATYTSGGKSIKLSVMDSAGLGALAGIAGAAGVESSHEDADGYERTSTVDGNIQVEKWNKKDNRGEFTREIGGRFFVSAEGEAGSIDELKAAVNGIDPATLAGLAR